jgi:uncharacterized membrane protein YfcA
MTILTLTLIVFLGSMLAGFLGSLTGLGGGVVIIPMLTVAFGIDIRYAIGASIVAVIATSSGAAAAYVKEGITNIRLGMFLEIATTAGAIMGAFFAVFAPTSVIAIIFGVVLIISAVLSLKKKQSILTPTIQAGYPGFSGLMAAIPTVREKLFPTPFIRFRVVFLR